MAFSSGYRSVMVWLIVMGSLGSAVAPTDAHSQIPADTLAAKTIRGGRWAVQFQWTQNFTLTAFQGALLSIKRHWSPTTALRVGIDGTVSAMEFDETRRSMADTIFSQGQRQGEEHGRRVGVVAQYVRYVTPRASVSLFWGGGPLLRWARTTSEGTIQDTVGTSSNPRLRLVTSITRSTNRTWGGGVSGVVGTEWWLTTRLSVLAEYGLTVEYESGRITSHSQQVQPSSPVQTTDTDGHRRGFRFAPLAVKVGVSVSF